MSINEAELQLTLNMLKARTFLFMMSDEVPSIRGYHAAPLFDLVGDMTENEAREALVAYENAFGNAKRYI